MCISFNCNAQHNFCNNFRTFFFTDYNFFAYVFSCYESSSLHQVLFLETFTFLFFMFFPLLCSHFCQSGAYLVVVSIFYYKLIEVFMGEAFHGSMWASVLCWTRVCTVLWPTPNKLDVTSHEVMTSNGTVILDISFEQSSFALKLFLLCLIASSPLIIVAAYAHITTKSVSSESVSTGVVLSFSLILENKNNMAVVTSKWKQHLTSELFN